MSNEQKIWSFLFGKIGNAYGVAGLMGNLYAESGLRANNLQNSYEKSLGMSDEKYTTAVDNGSYTNFAKDSAGYGLAQWTFHTRKAALLAYAKSVGASIGSLDMQLNFLYKELSENYKTSVLAVLKSAKSVREASDVVLTKFERPADQSEAVKIKRAGYGQTYSNKYAATSGSTAVKKEESTMSNSSLVSYTKLSPNHSGQRTMKIDRITPHCVVGQCSVETLGNIFAPASRQASCNYGIGVDGRVGMYVEEKNRSWCSSSSANDQRAVTIECASDTEAPYAFIDWLLTLIFDGFKIDVSYMSDEEYATCMTDTFNKLEYRLIPKEFHTGEKIMEKSINVGDQLAQIIGIYYPHKIDTYIKYVRGQKYYGRYMDDWYIMAPTKEELLDLLENIRVIAAELGIHINDKKTRIVKISSTYKYLQIKYSLTSSGKVIKRINPERVTALRRKLKKLAIKVQNGEIPYENVENAFKGWMGSFYKLLSKQQRVNLITLYEELFDKSITILNKKLIITDNAKKCL